MNNKIKISLCITLFFAGKAMGMYQASPALYQASPPSYQSLGDNLHVGKCANYPAQAGPLETELVALTRQLNDNAISLARATKQQAASEKSLPLVLPIITGLLNGVLDIPIAAFVDQQYFWQPASSALCNATLGLGCLVYALTSRVNARKQKQDLGMLMLNQHETQSKHDRLFEKLYDNKTHLVGERNLTRSQLMDASASSCARTMYQTQLKDMYSAEGQEEAQRTGLYCLIALCTYNMVKDTYFWLSFINSDPAKKLTWASAVLNGLGCTAATTLCLNSIMHSRQNTETILDLLKKLDALNRM